MADLSTIGPDCLNGTTLHVLAAELSKQITVLSAQAKVLSEQVTAVSETIRSAKVSCLCLAYMSCFDGRLQSLHDAIVLQSSISLSKDPHLPATSCTAAIAYNSNSGNDFKANVGNRSVEGRDRSAAGSTGFPCPHEDCVGSKTFPITSSLHRHYACRVFSSCPYHS